MYARTLYSAAFVFSLFVLTVGCDSKDDVVAPTNPATTDQEVADLRARLAEIATADSMVNEHLATFDELDFEVFTKQQWDRLHESHGKDIIVNWPDGHVTNGIDVHIEDLKNLFVHAPDTRILSHPIKFGVGDMTVVTGVFEGTFTEPLPLPDGSSIPPTGKAFKMPMATIGIWTDGVMTEEHLFWDNQTYARQIGLE